MRVSVSAAPGLAAISRPRAVGASLGPLGFEGLLGVMILVGIAFASFLVPALSAHGPSAIVGPAQQAPSSAHLFGTDTLGRDVFIRVFAAGKTDLTITLVSVTISLLFGTGLGIAIGCADLKVVRGIALRLVDAVLAIPYVILVITLVVLLGATRLFPTLAPAVTTVILAIIVVAWAPYARMAAAQTLVVRSRESVVAARLLGYGRLRVLARHIAPSVIGPCLAYAATQAVITTAITASLAFLGSGVQEPTPELGTMMQEGTPLIASAWWMTVFPGALILLLGIGFALIGDALSMED